MTMQDYAEDRLTKLSFYLLEKDMFCDLYKRTASERPTAEVRRVITASVLVAEMLAETFVCSVKVLEAAVQMGQPSAKKDMRTVIGGYHGMMNSLMRALNTPHSRHQLESLVRSVDVMLENIEGLGVNTGTYMVFTDKGFKRFKLYANERFTDDVEQLLELCRQLPLTTVDPTLKSVHDKLVKRIESFLKAADKLEHDARTDWRTVDLQTK